MCHGVAVLKDTGDPDNPFTIIGGETELPHSLPEHIYFAVEEGYKAKADPKTYFRRIENGIRFNGRNFGAEAKRGDTVTNYAFNQNRNILDGLNKSKKEGGSTPETSQKHKIVNHININECNYESEVVKAWRETTDQNSAKVNGSYARHLMQLGKENTNDYTFDICTLRKTCKNFKEALDSMSTAYNHAISTAYTHLLFNFCRDFTSLIDKKAESSEGK